jgi:K+-transporting ATPase ATPase C chain
MRTLIAPALSLLAIFTALTGVLYPLAVTGAARVLFARQSQGSLVVRDGRVAGSTLIGQPFDDPRYFWGRPSATSPVAYSANASSGSNLGPSNPALVTAARARIAALRDADPGHDGERVPVDLVTASASGLDPHVSPAGALFQVRRVSWARGLSEGAVRALVERNVEPRTWGVLGEPRVNVLALNVALDALSSGAR